jgi:hypothetical protein
MPTPLEGIFGQLTKARAQNLPTRQEVNVAEQGHLWVGKKGDGTMWSLKKTAADTFEIIV